MLCGTPLSCKFRARHQRHTSGRLLRHAALAKAAGHRGARHKGTARARIVQPVAFPPLDKGVGVELPVPGFAVGAAEGKTAALVPEHVRPLGTLALDR